MRARLAVAVATAVGATAFALFAEYERVAMGRSVALALLDLAAGLVFVAAGAVVWWSRPTNRCWWLLMAAGGTWFLSTLAGAGNEDLALLGFATGAWHYLFLAWLLLAFPSGRTSGSRSRWLLASMAVLLALRTLSRLFLFVPPDGTGCGCVQNRFLPVTDPRWFNAVETAYPWVVSVLFALVIGETLDRWRRSSGAGRRMLGPVLALGVAVAVQIGYAQVIRQELAWAILRADDLFLLVVLTRSLAAVSFVVGLRRTGSTRSAVVGMVGELGESADPARLQAALRRALQDPSLVLLPWSEEEGGYAGGGGRASRAPDPGPGRAVTLVDADGSHLAALVHDEALLEDPGLVSAVSAAVRLTVDNERLRLELQRRLDDLAASRARIIAAGDDERRRIERDLHDGTQQRLVTIALRLRLAEARLPEGDSTDVRGALTQAVDDLAAVVAEVRDLARGIHPAILAESGLHAALESLADRSPVPVRTAIEVPVEPHERVAATAYFCVAEALTNVAKHANATRAVLEARIEHGTLRIVVSDDGVGGARPPGGESRAGSGLSGLEDRVNASGGMLRVLSPPGGGTRIEVELPCA